MSKIQMSGNPTNQDLRLTLEVAKLRVNYVMPVNRIRTVLGFIFCGGLSIFLSPYLIYKAAVKRMPWSVVIIAIPFYTLLSYGAFKVYWPRMTNRDATSAAKKKDAWEQK